ncbi:MAG: hypothetical protein Q9162_004116 [Coniocarpon cinnabarinum]
MSQTEAAKLLETAQITYFAEGAANVVYRHLLTKDNGGDVSTQADLHDVPKNDSSTTPPPSEISPPPSPSLDAEALQEARKLVFPGWDRPPLLRLKKALPHLPLVEDQFRNLSLNIVPLLPNSALVKHQLVELPASLLKPLNDKLVLAERQRMRAEMRVGCYLDDRERYGMLVEDMSSPSQAQGFGLEVKPKWLAQSPTAPKNARRCRTCALRVQRTVLKANTSSNNQAIDYCPLDLVSRHRADVHRASQMLLKRTKRGIDVHDVDKLTELLTDFIFDFGALTQLRDLQTHLDRHGILTLDDDHAVPDDFLRATTLRDCSLFLRINANDSLEGKLGDFDLKTPEQGRVQYWKSVEQGLIDGGFYQARDGWSSGCRLER